MGSDGDGCYGRGARTRAATASRPGDVRHGPRVTAPAPGAGRRSEVASTHAARPERATASATITVTRQIHSHLLFDAHPRAGCTVSNVGGAMHDGDMATATALDGFSPATRAWFDGAFAGPTQ